jgi:protein-tyrosine phosphatase
VRCDDTSRLNESGRASALAYGVSTVVDLRNTVEVAEGPCPLCGHEAVEYHNVSLVDPATSARAGLPDTFTTLAADYIAVLERYPDRFAQVFDIIALAQPGTVLVNCVVGKDRTGIVSALLLSLAGVSDDLIAADYALTTDLIGNRVVQWIESGHGDRSERERAVKLLEARKDVMIEVLNHLHGDRGGPVEYLRKAGLDDATIAAARRRLTPQGN